MSSEQDVTLNFGTNSYTIKYSQLSRAKVAIDTARNLRDIPESGGGILSTPELRNAEVTYSALFARLLDRFLFEDGDDAVVGACLHQGPVRKQVGRRGNPEAADMYVMPMNSSTPRTPVLLSDIKRTGLVGVHLGDMLFTAFQGGKKPTTRFVMCYSTLTSEYNPILPLVHTCK